MRRGNRRVVKFGDQRICRAPSVLFALANNDMQTDSKGQAATALGRRRTDCCDLLRDIGNRFAPCEINIDMFSRNLNASSGRAAEIKWGGSAVVQPET